MKYDSKQAFEKHLEGSSPKHFSNLYLIMGKEYFDCKEAVDALLSALLPGEKEKQLCLRLYDGSYLEIDDVITDLNSTSFFYEKRVIWIQAADKLKKNAIEALEIYFAHPHRSHYLLLTAPGLVKTTQFYKKIEKIGVVLELAEIKPWEREKKIIDWVSKQVLSKRKLISYQTCQYLVKYCGSDQAFLQQELEKLFCYIGDKKEITIQDIESICTQVNTETIWQLGESIFRRDGATALRISRRLLEDGTAFLPFLRQIRNQFQTGCQIGMILVHGGQSSDVTQEFPYMKGQILERHIQLTQNYGLEKFREGLLIIDAIEMQAKNSQIEESLLNDLLIAKLIS